MSLVGPGQRSGPSARCRALSTAARARPREHEVEQVTLGADRVLLSWPGVQAVDERAPTPDARRGLVQLDAELAADGGHAPVRADDQPAVQLVGKVICSVHVLSPEGRAISPDTSPLPMSPSRPPRLPQAPLADSASG